MDKRSTEGHMDYEWQDSSGPVDTSSPFMKHAAAYQQEQAKNGAKKRPFSVLNSSPSKANTFPSLRPPTSQSTFLFSQPSADSPTKPLPPTPLSTNPAFMTPRIKHDINYDSSEVDLTSSPDYNPDSDATPDKMGVRSGLAKTTSTLSQILAPEKTKKSNSTANRLSALSGKGELQRSVYHTGVEKRVRRKRSRTGTRWLTRRKGSSGSESDDEQQAQAQKPAGPGVIASLFGFIEMHPDIPHILSFYAQLLLNVFLVLFFIYIVYCFWATIRSDVDKKSEEAIADILAEMAVCAQNYQQNGCGNDKRPPALESVCNNWERCMNKDPRAVGRARVSAHTFAEIFNSFIEPISYKAMIFTFILIFGCVGISNFAFGFFRSKSHLPPPPPPMAPQPQYMQSPHRSPSGTQEFYWNAYQSPMARHPEANAAGGPLDAHSPTRRLQY